VQRRAQNDPPRRRKVRGAACSAGQASLVVLLALLIAPVAEARLAEARAERLGRAEDPARELESQRTAARAALGRVAKKLEGVRELRADYTQEQHSLLLEEPLVSRGRMHLRAEPGCIVLELDEPRRALIRSDARTHQIYHPERQRAERFLFESNELARALLACFSADLERIEEIFTIAAYAEDAEQRRARVELVPRREEVRAALRALTLELDLEQLLPVRIVQVNSEGEEVRLDLARIVLDPERAPGETPIFDRPLPPGVEVVERRVPPPGGRR
jgi:hypothetical protein